MFGRTNKGSVASMAIAIDAALAVRETGQDPDR